MLELINITKSFGEVKALDNISLKVYPGNFLALLGSNGAGKTTIFNIINSLIKADKGQVLFEGREFKRNSYDIKKKFGVVSQELNLDKELTVSENLIFSGKLYKLKKDLIKERTEYLLNFFGLNKQKDKITKHLSGGNKRKLMIAKALLHEPSYLLLDEPTVGLDVKIRKEIWFLLKNLQKKGLTIILTSHYIEEAEALCERVVLIKNGKIIQNSLVKDLVRSLGNYTLEYYENDLKHAFFKNLEEAKEASKNLKTNFSIRETNLEDVFYKNI